MESDDRPVYIRLRDEITDAILEGKYRDGDALPSVRNLATAHGANPLTVAKAYQTFQDDKMIVVRRGVGMFVAEGASARLRELALQKFFESDWPKACSQIKRLGLSLDDLALDAKGDLEPSAQ